MAWVAVAVAGTTLISGALSADAQGDAAQLQSDSAAAGVAEQRRQFNAIQQLLAPYVNAGTSALGQQGNLIGLNGNGAQQQAINALRNSPLFTSQLQQGERSILANASATGGLRGGNTQAALAQFSPALLAQTIQQQYQNLGGLTSLGQNAAAGVGNAGMTTGSNIAQLLQQQGAAQAGGALAGATMGNSIAGAVGQFAGLGGFGRIGSSPASSFGWTGSPEFF
jgi:hypothetical protein